MAKKKKSNASLDEILAKLNQAEQDFKSIYNQVDFESFRVKEVDQDGNGSDKTEEE